MFFSSDFQFDDEKLFCDDCRKFHENFCRIHRQIYVPDGKVSKPKENFAESTCPEGISIENSTVENAGRGVFAKKVFEKNTFFGPYLGKRHKDFQIAQQSGYAWSITDKHGKVRRFSRFDQTIFIRRENFDKR